MAVTTPLGAGGPGNQLRRSRVPSTRDLQAKRVTLAAIFDFDGTLVDTMPLHFAAYRRAFAECCQVELTEGLFLSSIGGPAHTVVPVLIERLAVDVDPAVLHAHKKRVLRMMLASADVIVLETAKLLPVLRPFMRIGLASSGSRQGIEILLDRLGWDQLFDTVVTGEDVTNGKPSPEPFLEVARRLGVAPERCIAFEDTDAGVQSATAAGMTTFDVRRPALGRRA